MFGLVVVVGLIALICYGFYTWARRNGQLAGSDQAGEVPAPDEAGQRIPLVTEAIAYVGVVLILAGGLAAIAREWHRLSPWGHVGLFAGAAVLFLVLGAAVAGAREPALQRLVGVAWFVSVGGVAGATAAAAAEVAGLAPQTSVLTVGVTISVYSGLLWLIRTRALQNAALFLSLIVALSGTITTLAGGDAPALAFGMTLWAFGLLWMGLGWGRQVEPMWVSLALGLLLALLAPSFAVDGYGWMFALALATSAAAMAASVPLRNTVMLGVGTVAAFAYLTSMLIRYFADSLGVPAALSVAGLLVLVLAAVGSRLLRATRTPAGGEPPNRRPDPKLPRTS